MCGRNKLKAKWWRLPSHWAKCISGKSSQTSLNVPICPLSKCCLGKAKLSRCPYPTYFLQLLLGNPETFSGHIAQTVSSLQLVLARTTVLLVVVPGRCPPQPFWLLSTPKSNSSTLPFHINFFLSLFVGWLNSAINSFQSLVFQPFQSDENPFEG